MTIHSNWLFLFPSFNIQFNDIVLTFTLKSKTREKKNHLNVNPLASNALSMVWTPELMGQCDIVCVCYALIRCMQFICSNDDYSVLFLRCCLFGFFSFRFACFFVAMHTKRNGCNTKPNNTTVAANNIFFSHLINSKINYVQSNCSVMCAERNFVVTLAR